jgi:hypothetical protein
MRVSTPAILPPMTPTTTPRSRTQMGDPRAHPRSYHDPQPPDGRPRRATRLSLLGQAVEPGRSRRLRASQDGGHLRSRLPRQHDRRQLPHSQPEQTTGPLADTAGDHAGAGPSQPRSAALPHRRSTNRPWRRQGRTRTQDARTQDTRRPDTRRPDTGHPQTGHRYTRHWTPGHRSTRTPDTRTPEHADTGARGHRTGATNGVASIRTSSTIRPRRRPAGHRTVPPGGRRLRAAINASSATATRPAPPTHPGGDRAPPRRLCTVQARLGALLSSNDYGSRVERAAKLHPLWRSLESGRCGR